MQTDSATQLDREFLGIRAKLIDLGAAFDRIDRAAGPSSGDPRIGKIEQAIKTLADQSPNRAEKIQLLFSLPYDEHWQR